MNPQELQQKIAEYYAKLPPEAQEIFSSLKWMEVLKNIGVKYNLNDSQIEDLSVETTLVLLGIVHSEGYEKDMVKQLGLPLSVVDKMLAEINEQILKPIKVKLNETFEKNVKSFENQLAEVPIPPEDMVPIQNKNEIKRVIPNNLPISNVDSGIMKNAGIEIGDTPQSYGQLPLAGEQESKMTMKEDNLLVKSGISLIEDETKKEEHLLPNDNTQKSALYGIEHPQKTQTNLIERQLGGVISHAATVSDHTINKKDKVLEAFSSANSSHDQYREIV